MAKTRCQYCGLRDHAAHCADCGRSMKETCPVCKPPQETVTAQQRYQELAERLKLETEKMLRQVEQNWDPSAAAYISGYKYVPNP